MIESKMKHEIEKYVRELNLRVRLGSILSQNEAGRSANEARMGEHVNMPGNEMRY